MAWPENALTDGEGIITSFRQHWKLLAIPFAWFVVLAAAAMGLLVWLEWPKQLEWAVYAVIAALAVWFVVRPLVSWATTRYVLTNERLITRRGLVAKSGVEIPLERITDVNFSQSVFERILGAGDLLVESAGTGGQSRFSNIPHPDDFASVLYKVREDRAVALQGGGRVVTQPSDATERLQRLKQLHNDGVLTDEEYEEKRSKLVEEI